MTKTSSPGNQSYQLAGEVRLRRTPEGGAAFLPSRALAVDLDDEALALLTWLNGTAGPVSLRSRACREFGRNFTIAEIDRVLRQLEEIGVLHKTSGIEDREKSYSPHRIPDIAAPECVHVQLTDSCNQHCPSCYLSDHVSSVYEPDFDRIITLVDEMANLGVFQLAIGGGEPLMSSKLVPLVQHARSRGILPNITTNGRLLSEEILHALAGHVGEIRLSCNDGKIVSEPWFTATVNKIRQAGINVGFNLIVARVTLPKLRGILAKLGGFSPTSLVLVRPKPGPTNEKWYAGNALTADDCRNLAHIIEEVEVNHGALALDCAFSFLFCKLPEKQLCRLGVEGLSAVEKICRTK